MNWLVPQNILRCRWGGAYTDVFVTECDCTSYVFFLRIIFSKIQGQWKNERAKVLRCHVNKEYARFSLDVFSRILVRKSSGTVLVWSLKYVTVPTFAVSRASDFQFKPSPFNAEVMFGRCLSQLRLRADIPVFFLGVMFHDRSVAASKASLFFTDCDLMLPVSISYILSFP